MDVALQRETHLRLIERLDALHPFGRLGDVELFVRFRLAVDVVKGGVAVDDLQLLPHLDAEDVRLVQASVLSQHHRFRRGGERAADPTLDVDQRVLKGAAMNHHLLAHHGVLMLLQANRIGRHFDLLRGGRGAGQGHLAGNHPAPHRSGLGHRSPRGAFWALAGGQRGQRVHQPIGTEKENSHQHPTEFQSSVHRFLPFGGARINPGTSINCKSTQLELARWRPSSLLPPSQTMIPNRRDFCSAGRGRTTTRFHSPSEKEARVENGEACCAASRSADQ